MNGIYFSTMCNINDSEDKKDLGIRNKILHQLKVFKQNNYEIYYFFPKNDNKIIKKLLRFPFIYENYRIEPEYLEKSDFIYIRKPSLINYGLVKFIKEAKKINKDLKILLEVPTYPYDNEYKNLKYFPLKIKDQFWRKHLQKNVDIILTYSNDDRIFNIPTLKLSNGIDYHSIEVLSKDLELKENNFNEIHCVACAHFNFWHGYERALLGLKNYYKEKQDCDPIIYLHFIGEGEELPKYKQITQESNLENFVKFHGKLDGKQLAEIYSYCDIGLDSMGRHRSNVYYNSSLKGKEYGAYGLIIVSGVETELDSRSDYKYYIRIPSDETPLNFMKIVKSFSELTSQGKKRLEIKKEIKEFTKQNFDYSVVFNPVIEWLKQFWKKN